MTIPYIPYFQTSRYRVAAMIELGKIMPGEEVADLGSGDGRIVIALSKAGAIATGYELDDTLIQLSRKNIEMEFSTSFQQYSSNEMNSLQAEKTMPPVILKKDFWNEDLSGYSVICCYPMPTIMGRLQKKLQTELRPGSRVLLNYFPFCIGKKK